MTEPVTTTLQRFFARHAGSAAPMPRRADVRSRGTSDTRPLRPDFAETRPVVFRSEAFAEDLVLSHGAV